MKLAYTLINLAIYEGDSDEMTFKTKKEMMKFLEMFEIFDLSELEEVGINIYKMPDLW